MAQIDTRKIRQVLREQLFTAVGIPATSRFAAENRKFRMPDPPAIWIRERLLPDEEPKVATAMLQAIGAVKYDVVGPQGEGTEAIEDLSKAIMAVFPHGASINSQGITVVIDDVRRKPGAQLEATWWFVPVWIFWRVHAQT